MTKMTMQRRRFLQALGLGVGAGLMTPLLDRVWAEDAGVVPKRFVIVMMGNGIEGHNLLSPAARDALTADRNAEVARVVGDATTLAQAPALSSLMGPADLSHKAAVVYGLSSKITGGSHTTLYKALSASKERRQTIDAWLAQQLHTTQPFSALRLGVTESESAKLQYGICLQGPQQELPIIANPQDGHAAIFGSIAAGAGKRSFDVQADLLDFAREDVNKSLEAFSGGSRERQKLEQYLSALEELKTQQQRLVDSGDALRGLANAMNIDPESGAALTHADPLTRLEGQFQLAAASLIGNLTNVVLLTCSAGYAFSHTKYTSLRSIFEKDANFSGQVPWRHGVCHEAGLNPVYQEVLDRVIARQVEMITALARKLDAVPERDGTMLDHTVIVFMSDNGSSHHSSAELWPTLLMGGGKLGLKTGGQTVLYPSFGKEKNLRTSNLFNTLGHLAGHELNDFGGEPDKAQRGGPLSELLS